MNIVEMPIAELVAAPYNPRKALKAGDPEYAKLRRSIEQFGLVDPVIWNSRTKRVVGGHQRLTVLRDLGHTTAPTVVIDLDERREKALNIALNKIADAWGLMLLRDLLKEIEVSGEDVTLTGFDPKRSRRSSPATGTTTPARTSQSPSRRRTWSRARATFKSSGRTVWSAATAAMAPHGIC